jgi:hypothetical protein
LSEHEKGRRKNLIGPNERRYRCLLGATVRASVVVEVVARDRCSAARLAHDLVIGGTVDLIPRRVEPATVSVTAVVCLSETNAPARPPDDQFPDQPKRPARGGRS